VPKSRRSAARVERSIVGNMPTHKVKRLDRFIQRWRVNKIRRYVPQGGRVLDIGCADGAMFRQLRRIGSGVGVDPALVQSVQAGAFELIAGSIPDDLAPAQFDVATMLAVVEHLPEDVIAEMRDQCVRLLKPGGLVLITVPSPTVDNILKALIWLRLVGNMSFDQHHGFDVRTVPARFGGTGLTLVAHRRFQLGLNHLYVFRRVDTAPDAVGALATHKGRDSQA
jgi:2-polyprenyl-3-methyl-5-hydroxy-6-metoxy-1,4-benzoquinol methylase